MADWLIVILLVLVLRVVLDVFEKRGSNDD